MTRCDLDNLRRCWLLIGRCATSATAEAAKMPEGSQSREVLDRIAGDLQEAQKVLAHFGQATARLGTEGAP